MTLYCLIRHKRFPPEYEYVLHRCSETTFLWEGDFGQQGENMYRLYMGHRDELKEAVGRAWKKLENNKILGGPISCLYFTTHLVIVSALLFLALIALPFMTPYCLIRYKRFPPDYRHALYRYQGSALDYRRGTIIKIYKGDFGKTGVALYHSYENHREKLEVVIDPCWEGIKEFFAANFRGWWKNIKGFVWKPDVPVGTSPPGP